MTSISKLSFVYLTIRAGSIDILASVLSAQDKSKPWELIVVDGYPGRVQRGWAERFLVHAGLPLKAYVEPKPKTFPWSRTGFANAINTGALHASGEFVVYLHDYTVFPPDMTLRWWDVLSNTDGRTLVHGVAQEYESDPPDVLDDIRTWSKKMDLRYRRDWIPELFELGYFGIPIKFFEECNGIDERADFCFNFATRATIAHARALGYSLKVEPSLVCGMIDHHLWPVNGKPSEDSKWVIPGVYSDVPAVPNWTGWGANPFLFSKERQRILEELNNPVRTKENHYILPESAIIK